MFVSSLGVVMTLLAGSAMAMPPAPSPFTEEAVQRGVNYGIFQTAAAGLGVAFADLDSDGDPDLIVTGALDGHVGVYENDGTGFFTDRSAGSGFPSADIASGVTAADYDGDGDLDVFITQTALPDILMRNDGGFTFTNVAAQAGVNSPGAGKGAAWGDFNNDGWLDLYVPNRTGTFQVFIRDHLYLNNGDGTFTDVAAVHGLGLNDSLGHQAVFLDYDKDGDSDLYLSNDGQYQMCAPGGGTPNFFYENTGTTFVDVTAQTGTGVCMNSMGVAVGDLDGNGYPDLYATNTPQGNRLYLNNGDKTFTDATATAGVELFGVGWGAIFFDYNHDGIMDLYVCDMLGPNAMYVGQGTWPMVDMGEQLGLGDPGQSFCSAVADIDGDGDLDIAMTNQEQDSVSNVRLYINHEGEKRNWVKFKVLGMRSNKHAVGAMVDIRVGDKHYFREVYAGSSWKSQNDMILHVGLGDDEVVDEITTLWPGGEVRTVAGVGAGKTWNIVPRKRLGDINDNNFIDLSDFVYFASRYELPFEPGSEIVDFNGDSSIDMADFTIFMDKYSGPILDCDLNGEIDLAQILVDPSLDLDQDGMIDSCDGAAPTADLNGDGVVDGADLAALLAAWGASGGVADINGDGKVDGADLAMLLASWGDA